MFTSQFSRAMTRVGIAFTLSAGLAMPAHAQRPETLWQPWVGCWLPETPQTTVGATGGQYVCVVPTANPQVVDIATLSEYKVMHTERITANGERIAKTLDNCPGWESATWSADGHRLLMRSEYTCANQTVIKGSGVFAISPDGHWVQVQGNSIGKNTNAHAVQYQAVGMQIAAGESLADSSVVRTTVRPDGMAARAMRQLASEPADVEGIIDVTKHVDASVAQAWLAQTGQRSHSVDSKALVKMADAGVPSSMLDMVVALSYPERYTVQARSSDVAERPRATSSRNGRTGAYSGDYIDNWDCGYGNSMMDYGYYGGGCYPRYGSIYSYGTYNRSPYGTGYAYGYGPNYFDGYYYGSSPIIVVGRGSSKPTTTGRAVNGQGYTRTGGEPSGSAQRTGTSSSGGGAPSAGSSPTTTSKSAGSTTTSGGGDSGARTAKARPPK